MPLNIAREEIVGEGGIAGNRRQCCPGIGDCVWMVDVAGRAATRLPEALPHRTHEVVKSNLARRSLSQRQVETQRNRLAPGVVRDEGILEIGPVDRRGGIDKRRHLAHFLRRADLPARAERHRVDGRR